MIRSHSFFPLYFHRLINPGQPWKGLYKICFYALFLKLDRMVLCELEGLYLIHLVVLIIFQFLSNFILTPSFFILVFIGLVLVNFLLLLIGIHRLYMMRIKPWYIILKLKKHCISYFSFFLIDDKNSLFLRGKGKYLVNI